MARSRGLGDVYKRQAFASQAAKLVSQAMLFISTNLDKLVDESARTFVKLHVDSLNGTR
jgi:hypothetical protein